MLNSLVVLIQAYTLFITVAVHSGPSTQFSSVDIYNPNPTLACTGQLIDDNSYIVAHRSLPCGTLVRVCNKDMSKCVQARVLDRGPYGCKRKRGNVCEEYRSDLDLSLATAKAIGHKGFEEIIFLSREDETWRRPVKKKKLTTS